MCECKDVTDEGPMVLDIMDTALMLLLLPTLFGAEGEKLLFFRALESSLPVFNSCGL